MGAIDALVAALKGFTGGVLAISHDQHFIQQVCSQIWVVGGGRVTEFKGAFEDYKRVALEEHQQRLKNSNQHKGK